MEKAQTEIPNDSILSFKLYERNYLENLTFDRQKHIFRNKQMKINYIILKNELFK
jgi:hypothetical protein